MPPEKKVITKEFVHKVSSFSVELECLWKKVLQIIDFFIIILMVNNSVQTVLYVKKKKIIIIIYFIRDGLYTGIRPCNSGTDFYYLNLHNNSFF